MINKHVNPEPNLKYDKPIKVGSFVGLRSKYRQLLRNLIEH